MSYFISGSHALLYWLPDTRRSPIDMDVFLPENETVPNLISKNRIEYHYFPKNIFDLFVVKDNYIDLKSLYVLKLSHAEYPIHWEKTINDLTYIKKVLGIISYIDLEPKYVTLYNELKKYWKTKHKKQVKLNQDKNNFFTDKVSRKYDHDLLHKYVAYGNTPLYEKILKDNQEVMIDKNKFNHLSYADQLKVCREEITVIAIERFIIPDYKFMGYYKFYRQALKKVVTSMTTGWFNNFIIENYYNLIIPDQHCFQKMKNFSVDFGKKSSMISNNLFQN